MEADIGGESNNAGALLIQIQSRNRFVSSLD